VRDNTLLLYKFIFIILILLLYLEEYTTVGEETQREQVKNLLRPNPWFSSQVYSILNDSRQVYSVQKSSVQKFAPFYSVVDKFIPF